MLIIALTGGIGAGKTTVADLFAKYYRIPIIDTDTIAHTLIATNAAIRKKIQAHYGTLERTQLRSIIFKHPQKRQWLEKILHPKIYSVLRTEMAQLKHAAKKHCYCIVVIPLLAETNSRAQQTLKLHRIIVVDSTKARRIARVQARSALSYAEITAICKAQSTRQARLKIATDIITNNNDKNSLQTQVKKLHKIFMSSC